MLKYILIAITLLAISCCALPPANSGTNNTNNTMDDQKTPRNMNPSAADTDITALASGNTAFGFNLYKWLIQQNDNLIFSPYSISVALAMTYAGATGETKQQMKDVLNFDLDDAALHPAFNKLDLTLSALGQNARNVEEEGTPFTLNITNSLWIEKTFPTNPTFLDTVTSNYDAGVNLMDFINDPNGSRVAINSWIEDKTEGKIPNAVPPDAITPNTRMALVNAIYFLANWAKQFEEAETGDGTFHTFTAGDQTVPMMHMTDYFRYAEGDTWQALSMMYVGYTTSMLVILPKEGEFENVENMLDENFISGVMNNLRSNEVKVTFPKFEYRSSFELSRVLSDMGMPAAFEGGFHNMVADTERGRDLFISSVIHQAFVKVDESGTEAAAVTVVIMAETSAPVPGPEPIEFKADRPFIFVITEDSTKTILFIGRVMDPS